MGPDDAAILVTHAPLWLSAWCAAACPYPTSSCSPNSSQLDSGRTLQGQHVKDARR
jgi:hypothetical protein